MLSTKAIQRFFLVAMLASVPLSILVAVYSYSTSLTATILLFLAPVVIGFIAIGWLSVILRSIPRLWDFSAAVTGAVVGALSFLSYAVLVAIGAEILTSTSWSDVLLAIGGWGMLLYGWVPLVFGGFAGWLAYKTERHSEKNEA